MKTVLLAVVIAVATVGLEGQSRTHVIQAPKDAQWGPAPPFIPAGAQIAVLAGDPTKAVPYAVRLKFPANYTIGAHSHPTDEHVVVTSGALTFGMGDKTAKGAPGNITLPPGGFALMPAKMNHFAYTASETTIVLYGTGPVEFNYANPADDPRNTKSTAR